MAMLKISILLLIAPLAMTTDYSEEDLQNTIDQLPITCSSTIRLQNVRSTYFLHSSELSYGSGSGQ